MKNKTKVLKAEKLNMPEKKEYGRMYAPPIRLATTYALVDEPSLGIYEMHEQSPGYRGFHRYQILYVIREGDKIAEYRVDMGPVQPCNTHEWPHHKGWRGQNEIRIAGGCVNPKSGKIEIVETVGRLMEFAERMRNDQMKVDRLELEAQKKTAKEEIAKLAK